MPGGRIRAGFPQKFSTGCGKIRRGNAGFPQGVGKLVGKRRGKSAEAVEKLCEPRVFSPSRADEGFGFAAGFLPLIPLAR